MKISLRMLVPTVLLVCSISCGNQNPPELATEGVKKTTPSPDGQVYQGDDFSITLPKTWKMVDFSHGDLDSLWNIVSKEPKFAGMESMLKSMSANKQIKFFALIPEYSENGFAANLNALVVPLPSGISPEQVFKANQDQIAQLFGKPVVQQNVAGNGGNAARFDYVNTTQSGKSSHVSIIAVTKGKQIALTFTFPEGEMDRANELVEEIVSSITLK